MLYLWAILPAPKIVILKELQKEKTTNMIVRFPFLCQLHEIRQLEEEKLVLDQFQRIQAVVG